jgi:hypothetical protein
LGANRGKTLLNLAVFVLLAANSTSGAEHTVLTSAFLDQGQPGATAADFLKIGIGARAEGMGGAFVGLADDPSAIYWNPAGPSQLDCSQAMFMHNRWAQDIAYECLGYALPIDPENTVAIAVTFLHMGEILGYDQDDNPTSSFSAYDAAILLGYSREISAGLSLGATAKAILEKLEDEKAQAAAFDIGLFYDLSILSFGLSLRNLGTELKFVERKHPLPTDLRAGIAVRVLNDHLLLSTDIDFLTDAPPEFRQGIECSFQNILFARGGVEYKTQNHSSPPLTRPTVGGGVRISNLQFDYTYSSARYLGDLHNFSLTYRFTSE